MSRECGLILTSLASIIKQNHKGAGAARNCGIQRAQGEYVCFLDADDFYASDDALEYLYRLAKRENAIICGGSSADYVDGIIRTEGLRKEQIGRAHV